MRSRRADDLSNVSGVGPVAVVLMLGVFSLGRAAGATEPAGPEARALRWVLTHGPSVGLSDEVSALASKPNPSAPDVVDRLLAIGEPARAALLRLSADDEPARQRLAPVLARLQSEEDLVEDSRLACSVAGLLAREGDAASRAKKIAPADAPAGWGLSWWAEHAHAYRFAPSIDRFVPWESWAADATPLRLRGRDRVVLDGSAGLVRWDSPVTVEVWVRWANRTNSQYLLTDEAWPELAPDVLPTATKRGFALRRNPLGDGRASLDLTFATAPNHWFSVESPPLAISDDWEHIAASSDGRVIRLFRDGRLVAARSIAGVRLWPGLGDVSIGVREHAMNNRVANYDLRALRVSEGARYVDDFVPAQTLDVDASTVLSPEFRPASAMSDRARRDRRHAIVGARWLPATDSAAVRDALAAFGGGESTWEPSAGGSPGRALARRASVVPIVVEADRGGRSAEWYLAERDGQSEGLNAEIWSDREPDEMGHWITVPVRVPVGGRHRVYLLGAGLEHLGVDGLVSPFSWRFDDAEPTVVADVKPSIRAVGGRWAACLSPIGEASLDAGEHLFRLRLLARRPQDGRYSLWLDAVVLVQ